MGNDWVIISISAAYLALLFGIAYYADRRWDRGRSLAANPYVYTLSIAVYCTAWTFYGSVGRAATAGVGFLPIYLGPTLMAALWWLVLRKIIRICKVHRITSIADFIASRYGKSMLLGGLASAIAVIAITPYIALQLKAISTSYDVLRHYPDLHQSSIGGGIWTDRAFYVAVLLAVFSILFGTRHLDATERHEGMVLAIAFESVVKLAAFLAVGLFVTFGLYDGPGALFEQAAALPEAARLFTMQALPGGYANWLTLTVLSMSAILFLPRQFQVTVVENVNEDHVRTAMWLFPLYLLVINLFVLPIAMGGLLHFPDGTVVPDTFVLTLPLAEGQPLLATFVFLGGLSAATGMVIVATIALSIMVSNDLVMPLLLRIRALHLGEHVDMSRLILVVRRVVIVAILLLGYAYYYLIGESYTLVTIGLVSFAAAAQFAPPILIGMYWRGAGRYGAIAGLCGGILVWAYTLLLPSFARSGWLPDAFHISGPGGVSALHPQALFGLTGLDPMTHSVFWSLLVNIGLLVGVSLFERQRDIDRIQGALFVEAFQRSDQETRYWRGSATVGDLHGLLARFLGSVRSEAALREHLLRRDLPYYPERGADPELVGYAERLLAGHIGAASARVMMGSVVQGEALTFEGVLEILDATSQAIEYSRRLEQKSRELEQATAQLRAANERLKELDRLKDEFVSMVSHELRTPLTSIRAFGEILLNNEDVDEQQRREFLGIVVKESERLTRLINQVLDLSKIESGWSGWSLEDVDLREVLTESQAAVHQLYADKRVALEPRLPEGACLIKGDRDRLMQLVINLLSNAVKFCPADEGRVVLSLERVPAGFRLEVADNGPGIPPAERSRIFDKFHQVTSQQAGKPQGSGLGLAISRRIVELHWGHIWVESEPGEGAQFLVELPEAGGEHCDVAAPVHTEERVRA